MLKAHFYNGINPYFKTDELLVQGQLVTYDTAKEGFIKAAEAGDLVAGVVAQDVVEFRDDSFKLTSVTHKAYKSIDHVGFYYDGGIFSTDQYTGTVTVGALLYAGANGQMTTTVPATGDTTPVARAEKAANKANNDVLKYTLLI